MNAIKAMNGSVILIPYVEEVKLGSGIIQAAPRAAEKPQNEAKVFDIDTAEDLTKFGLEVSGLDIKKGDRVIYKGTNVTRVKIDGTEYLIVPFKEIIAVVVPTPQVNEND